MPNCSRFLDKPGVISLRLSYSVPSGWQALPALLNLAHSQSFCKCLPGASRELPWNPWVGGLPSGPYHGFSQWPGQPLTQTIRWRGKPGSGDQEVGFPEQRISTREGHCRAGSETGSPQPKEAGSHEHHPSHAPAVLPARWATFSAQLFFSREKLLTFGNRLGSFQMGPRLVTGTMESGSPWLLPSTWPQTWLCPSEHTSGAARPKGQGRAGNLPG